MLLQPSMSFSITLARFTLQLNRRPDLTRRVRSVDEDSGGKSVAESSAEIIQKIFTTCLTDRSAGKVPEGKKVGVYMFANLVLKLLFAVGASFSHTYTRTLFLFPCRHVLVQQAKTKFRRQYDRSKPLT